MAQHQAVRFVALVEALKGVVVLLAASGLLSLIHHDLHAIAAKLIEHLHLNPASHYPSIFLDAASNLQEPRLIMLAAAAAAYSGLRLTEAYGLYFERAWAEWLAAISGAVYVPFELVELLHRRDALTLAILLLNLAVVAVMVRALMARRLALPARSQHQ